MPTTSEAQTFSVIKAAVVMDRDDPSIGEVRFLTDEGWREFQLARVELKQLAEELRDGLRTTAADQPGG